MQLLCNYLLKILFFMSGTCVVDANINVVRGVKRRRLTWFIKYLEASRCGLVMNVKVHSQCTGFSTNYLEDDCLGTSFSLFNVVCAHLPS